MKQIYTKTGDDGTTSLRNGVRVAKDDPRINANGQIDQLNAHLGIVRSMIKDDEANAQIICAVPRELMIIMSHIATPEGTTNPRELHCDSLVPQLEGAIDSTPHEGGFVIPGGGSTLAAFIHLARTQTRTVERCLWALSRDYPLDKSILRLMNRLSDYLFVLANEKE
ncbi:MAG: cob(I)yrinic acid a,c-diamide adenosyltransferase [Muribaculaceae bacterium]|nr:cob(I)yrinic acid a,c-diamide adenosyltransferase [Muribaculaceae bacterium]